MTNETLTWFGAMLTKDNMLDIAQYQRMRKMSGKDIDLNTVVQELIRIGADSFIREY